MSWVEKINDDLTIVTGDGLTYKPDWMGAKVAIEFNLSEFEYPNQNGTFAKRTTHKGVKYDLELHFQGDDHIDVSDAFLESSKDPREWTFIHPFFQKAFVQPLSLSFDRSRYNITSVTGVVVETINSQTPQSVVSPKEKVLEQKTLFNESNITGYDVIPSVTDVNEISEINEKSYLKSVGKIKEPVDIQDYFNLYSTASTKINNATEKPLQAMRAVQSMIDAPFNFTDNVRDRLNLLINQFNTLRLSLDTITERSSKKAYEFYSKSYISTLAIIASRPQNEEDYESRNDVVNVITDLIGINETYLSDMDQLQSEDNTTLDGFVPDYNSSRYLSNLLNYSISNLFQIALGSKQERSIVLQDDTNLISLAHRFYRLDDSDENIESLMRLNNIGLSEILLIKKNRTIKYYI